MPKRLQLEFFPNLNLLKLFSWKGQISRSHPKGNSITFSVISYYSYVHPEQQHSWLQVLHHPSLWGVKYSCLFNVYYRYWLSSQEEYNISDFANRTRQMLQPGNPWNNLWRDYSLKGLNCLGTRRPRLVDKPAKCVTDSLIWLLPNANQFRCIMWPTWDIHNQRCPPI